MTKMAAMPIYSKTFKDLLLQNQMTDDVWCWCTRSSSSHVGHYKFVQMMTLGYPLTFSTIPYAFTWETAYYVNNWSLE